MARDTYNKALAVQRFVRWAQKEQEVSDTATLEARLPELVETYIAGGGQIPESLQSPLEVVRTILHILPGPAEDYSFADLLSRFEDLLEELDI